MNSNDRFEAAATTGLDGGASLGAARALETVLVDDYARDERFDELPYALAMQSPGQGRPYYSAEELRHCGSGPKAGCGDHVARPAPLNRLGESKV
jgi:hypothetical protein